MASRNRDRIWLLPILLAALLAMVAAACGDGGDHGQTPSPDANAGTPAEGSPSPEATIPNARLPEDFPKDFPQYPRATISNSLRFGDQLLVTMRTDDPRADVAAFFREALGKPPWKVLIQQDEPTQGLILIRFAHLDKPISGIVSLITIGADSQSTDITLRFTLPESVGAPGESVPSPTSGS